LLTLQHYGKEIFTITATKASH